MKKAIGTVMMLFLLMGLAAAQEDCSDHDFYWHNGHHRNEHQCNPQKPLPSPPAPTAYEMTPLDYAGLAGSEAGLRSLMKNPDSFVLKAAFYRYNGPRTDADAAFAHAVNARSCAKVTIRENNVPNCTAKRDAEYATETAKYNATKLGEVEYCFLYKATNSYGAVMEETDCGNPGLDFVIHKDWIPVPTAPAPLPATPAEQAKTAQAYADCLKLAVDNPKIVCRQ